MPDKEIIRAAMITGVEEQLASDEAPEVNQAFDRLLKEGWSNKDAKALIAQCLALEFYGISKKGEPHNKERYAKNLENLPNEPSMDILIKREPVRVEKPIGRNEIVSVKYIDGRTVENIKFKKVQSDLAKGVCELIK